MNPQVQLLSNDDTLQFTLKGVNVSIANAIRRTILSDIPLIVFRTSPYEKNKATIITNTTRLNNEILKQRLSCIPIHIKEYDNFPIKKYALEVNVENNSDITIYVTTKDFIIKDLSTGKPLSESETREIFPANDYTGDFIDFVRLRPRISDDLPGEKIYLICEFDIGCAKEDGMFNVVSTSSYGFTIDTVAQDAELEKKRQSWRDDGKSKDEIEFESKNWKLLDGKRITLKDSFDFNIQTIGIYTNFELLDMACKYLIAKFEEIDNLIEKDELEIKTAENTMHNCFDIILENEDFTIGKVIEYFLYTKYYETKMLTYCGFKKMHPHDSYSIIRVAYLEPVEKSTIKGHLKECLSDSINIFGKIKKDILQFDKK